MISVLLSLTCSRCYRERRCPKHANLRGCRSRLQVEIARIAAGNLYLTFQQALLSRDSPHGFERPVELALGMFAGEDGPDPGFALRNGGEGDACCHHALVE